MNSAFAVIKDSISLSAGPVVRFGPDWFDVHWIPLKSSARR